jgi:hypothetical protein
MKKETSFLHAKKYPKEGFAQFTTSVQKCAEDIRPKKYSTLQNFTMVVDFALIKKILKII